VAVFSSPEYKPDGNLSSRTQTIKKVFCALIVLIIPSPKSKNVILIFNLILHLTYANLPEIVFDVVKMSWLDNSFIS